MDTAEEPGSVEPIQAPGLHAPLPGRTVDTFETYERCLADLIDLLGVERPALTADNRRARRTWQHQTRRAIGQAVRRLPVRKDWFEPLIRAAIYEPDPSFNRDLVAPTIGAFGRRRVQLALLRYLKTGTNPERAGAERAWYSASGPLSYLPGSRTPTPESKAEYDAVADLRQEWLETALHVFVANDDWDLRRRILPWLRFDVQHYPDELRPMVEDAARICRAHPDAYIRNRVEHQF